MKEEPLVRVDVKVVQHTLKYYTSGIMKQTHVTFHKQDDNQATTNSSDAKFSAVTKV